MPALEEDKNELCKKTSTVPKLPFAQAPENDAAYTREWERWAAPTIIILILSATAAIVLAGIAGRR